MRDGSFSPEDFEDHIPEDFENEKNNLGILPENIDRAVAFLINDLQRRLALGRSENGAIKDLKVAIESLQQYSIGRRYDINYHREYSISDQDVLKIICKIFSIFIVPRVMRNMKIDSTKENFIRILDSLLKECGISAEIPQEIKEFRAYE